VAGNENVIGVLALQGAVREHLEMVEACGARGRIVKTPSGLSDLRGLIIPGGESTAIGKLIEEYGFTEALREAGHDGMPIFGTCAGLIVLAARVSGQHGPLLGLADVTVDRNAFGRQVDSFEAELPVEGIEDPDRSFRGVFIRAPLITQTGEGVKVMARYDGGVVMARQGNYLLSAFHPELTGDQRVHRYFIDMTAGPGSATDTEVD